MVLYTKDWGCWVLDTEHWEKKIFQREQIAAVCQILSVKFCLSNSVCQILSLLLRPTVTAGGSNSFLGQAVTKRLLNSQLPVSKR
jgi:hypothetical protein